MSEEKHATAPETEQTDPEKAGKPKQPLVLVLAVVALIVALAFTFIKPLMYRRIEPNETGTIRMLQSFIQNAKIAQQFPKEEIPRSLVRQQMAFFAAHDSPEESVNGYHYRLDAANNRIIALPSYYGKSAVRTFVLDAEGWIWAKDVGAPGTDLPAADASWESISAVPPPPKTSARE